MKKKLTPSKKSSSLGEFLPAFTKFNSSSLLKEFESASFRKLFSKEKFERISAALCKQIAKHKSPCFLLPAITEFIEKINEAKILDNFSFSQFELWLNQYSGLEAEENYEIRAKIVGKNIPREAYQVFFPVGMGKTYPGSHFVTAHGSPDLDTTIASFWGWVDAFGARVSEGLHIWNVPGGAPSGNIEIHFLFEKIFGVGVFQYLAKNRTSLSVSSVDVMTQKGMVRKRIDVSSLSLDLEKNHQAVVLVDEQGFYQGDWRNIDVEGVRQVIMLLNQCLRWFESNFHQQLISLFSKEDLCAQDLPKFIRSTLDEVIADAEPAKEFSEKQRQLVEDYLYKVLKVEKGLKGSFGDLAEAIRLLSIKEFQEFIEILTSIQHSKIFDKKGTLVGDRKKLFEILEKVIKGLDLAIHSFRIYVDKLEVALRIKTLVFAYQPLHVNYRADVEEMRGKMGNNPYLTITAQDNDGKIVPMGVVHASDLYKSLLGTVSLRDFCNREETKIPSYLEVISVIDHHKGLLQTLSAPTVYISDAQSSNTMVARVAFALNDKYSSGGMSASSIAKQIATLSQDRSAKAAKRLLRKLLAKEEAATSEKKHFVSPEREFLEYLHFLYAILEDTDLLTKVSRSDVECVAELLNRLKSLMLQKEVEVIDFDDLAEEDNFVQSAASQLLRNEELYSLYRKIYQYKEKLIEKNLALCASAKSSTVFADTKEQNGCCRVGQTKLFPTNYGAYKKHAEALRRSFIKEAQSFYKEKPEIDLHLHMISTLAGVENLYAGKKEMFAHQDELWVWIPITQDQAVEHLKSFLNAFKNSAYVIKNHIEIVLFGKEAKRYAEIFSESFPQKGTLDEKSEYSMAVIRYDAGSMNSRKAMISPYLPRLVG